MKEWKMMKNRLLLIYTTVLLILILATGCRKNYTPKPIGYFRVDLPEHQYIEVDTLLPYRFEISKIAELKMIDNPEEKYWIDIVYPDLNAGIYCSYKAINNKLYELSEDAHRSVYKHIVRADDIIEHVFLNPDNQTYGIYYDLKGNAAAVAQFTLTDSLQHFFMAAVYFNHTPNKDSIAPMAEYIKEDIKHMMKTFSWK